MNRARKCFFGFAATLFLGAFVPDLRGWGEAGHKIVVGIAYKYLDSTTRTRIAEILGEETLTEAAIWPDSIKDHPNYKWTRPWHYINVPRDAEHLDMKRDAHPKGDVIQAIQRYLSDLKNPAASRKQKRDALAFLAHYVGDVHQPLHVSYADDRGGNQVQVVFFDKPTNLHSVWDTHMIEQKMKEGWSAYATQLRNEIPPQKVKLWSSDLNPVHWANESLQITRTTVYASNRPDELGPAYVERNLPVIEERLAVAGVRLASVLNEVFSDSAQNSEREPE